MTYNYFTLDTSHPLITDDKLQGEILLYNLDNQAVKVLQAKFLLITDKEININSNISELSGGQKVVLMALLALLSPAKHIRFVNLMHSLDARRREALLSLFADSTKDIVLEDILC